MIRPSYMQEAIMKTYLSLLEKSSDGKVSIQKVAKELKMSPQAIYKKHFSDVHEIVYAVLKAVDREIQNELSEYEGISKVSFLDFFADKLLPIIYKHNEKLKILFIYHLDITITFFQKRYKEIVQNYLEAWRIEHKFDLSSNFLSRVLIGNVVVIISCWLTDRIVPLSPNEFRDKFITLVSTSTVDLLGFSSH